MKRWFPTAALIFAASCLQQNCPSTPGGRCDPRAANCPANYYCAVAEICTHGCVEAADCWVKVGDGCRFDGYVPGQLQPDGGPFMETSDDGICPESKLLECVGGYCVRAGCARGTVSADGGCDYDVYGPSDYKGNRSQGPAQ